MIDHIGLCVADYARAKAFYTAALAPLGVTLVLEFPAEATEAGFAAAGFGRDGKPDLWIDGAGRTTPPLHIAITARTRAEVDAFHKAAIDAGATDNGAPGPRPHYHPDYYAAFVHDIDGHNLEAVCETPA